MAIDAGLLQRVREALEDRPHITEKRMFGGLAFLCDGHMFLGVRTGRLMVRVGPARFEEALRLPHVRPMVHGGRGMTGYVWVDTEALDDDRDLHRFVQWGADVAAALPAKEPVAEKKPAKRVAAKTTGVAGRAKKRAR